MGMTYVSINADTRCVTVTQMSGENCTVTISIGTKPVAGQRTRKPLQTYATLFVPVTSIRTALAWEK